MQRESRIEDADGILSGDFGELVDLVVVRVINGDEDLLVPTITPLLVLITCCRRAANRCRSRRSGLSPMGYLNCLAFGEERQDRPGIAG